MPDFSMGPFLWVEKIFYVEEFMISSDREHLRSSGELVARPVIIVQFCLLNLQKAHVLYNTLYCRIEDYIPDGWLEL